MSDLLNSPPMTQNVNKPLGHLSPSMMADDLKHINKLLSDMGAPINNNQSTQLGDIIQRLLWIQFTCEVRVLEQHQEQGK